MNKIVADVKFVLVTDARMFSVAEDFAVALDIRHAIKEDEKADLWIRINDTVTGKGLDFFFRH